MVADLYPTKADITRSALEVTLDSLTEGHRTHTITKPEGAEGILHSRSRVGEGIEALCSLGQTVSLYSELSAHLFKYLNKESKEKGDRPGLWKQTYKTR